MMEFIERLKTRMEKKICNYFDQFFEEIEFMHGRLLNYELCLDEYHGYDTFSLPNMISTHNLMIEMVLPIVFKQKKWIQQHFDKSFIKVDYERIPKLVELSFDEYLNQDNFLNVTHSINYKNHPFLMINAMEPDWAAVEGLKEEEFNFDSYPLPHPSKKADFYQSKAEKPSNEGNSTLLSDQELGFYSIYSRNESKPKKNFPHPNALYPVSVTVTNAQSKPTSKSFIFTENSIIPPQLNSYFTSNLNSDFNSDFNSKRNSKYYPNYNSNMQLMSPSQDLSVNNLSIPATPLKAKMELKNKSGLNDMPKKSQDAKGKNRNILLSLDTSMNSSVDMESMEKKWKTQKRSGFQPVTVQKTGNVKSFDPSLEVSPDLMRKAVSMTLTSSAHQELITVLCPVFEKKANNYKFASGSFDKSIII